MRLPISAKSLTQRDLRLLSPLAQLRLVGSEVFMGRWRSKTSSWISMVMLISLQLAACGAKPEEKPKAETPEEPAPEAQPAAPTAQKPAAAPAHAPTLAEIAARLATEQKTLDAADSAEIQKLIKASAADAKVLKALYPAIRPRFFANDGALNDDGKAVLALFADLERHGVDRSGYRFAQMDAANQKIVDTFAAERNIWLALEKVPRAALVAAAASGWLRGGASGEATLVKAGGDKLGPEGLRALDAAVGDLAKAAAADRAAMLIADLEISRAAIRYVVDFTLGLPAHPVKYMAPAQIRRLSDVHADKIIEELKLSKDHMAGTLKKTWPTHPQYAPLLQAYDDYKKLADAGGWQPLPKVAAGKKLSKGEGGPFIAALRQRLAVEGYEVGSGETFDETLSEAFATFQARHQLEIDAVLTKTALQEFDMPAAQRLKLIQLALQRLRESEGRDPRDFYVWVNVAFQRLWVMDGETVVQEHKVIVGNNDTDTDQGTQMKGKINRTKLFSWKMTQVILAPRWYPTQRVVELEIGREMMKNPRFLEDHGYVREMQADGSEVVYQAAGKANLLGDVKFRGPNKWNIYLHDTPFKQFFTKARRAFSHGCIRTQNPIELANLILSKDKGMSPGQIKDAIKEKEEKIVILKNQIWVHIDYVSVLVDEKGHVAFGADVYGYDQAFFDGQLPVEEQKEYKAGSARGL